MMTYVLVLSRNAYTGDDTMELNVVFEDGTADVITIDDNKYFDDEDAYMAAYPYTVNSDGTYDLETSAKVTATDGIYLLKDGTLSGLKDTDGRNVYPTVTDDSAVWDVTDMDDATEDAPAGRFTTREDDNQKAVVIYDNDGKETVTTAWVWDEDEDTETPDIDSDYRFETLSATANNGKVELSFTAEDEDLAGWQLGGPVNVSYAISKDDGRETTRNERLAKTGETISFNSLATGKLVIPGYTINSGSTGDYKVTVVIEFTGTTAGYDEGVTYTISGEYEFTID